MPESSCVAFTFRRALMDPNLLSSSEIAKSHLSGAWAGDVSRMVCVTVGENDNLLDQGFQWRQNGLEVLNELLPSSSCQLEAHLAPPVASHLWLSYCACRPCNLP